MRNSPVDPRRWQRLKLLLEQALDLDAEGRIGYLAALDDADADLRPDLERMLSDRTAREAQFLRRAESFGLPALSAAVSTEEDKADRVGQHLGSYRLLRLLGIGGMGSVYLAERDAGGFTQRVALKILETVLGPAMQDRFDRERQIIARLRHPCIASLFDGGEADGVLYYTMELIEGENIAEYSLKHTKTVEDRVRLLISVATALRYAHQNLVVHRDIKPSNILVTADGQVKLLDFGIAKLLDRDAGSAMTQAPLGPMTPGYAAPEQFRGGAISVATDIFQFGTLCYRLLTGRWPYRADPKDDFAWMKAVSEDEPLPLSSTLTSGKNEAAWPAQRQPGIVRRRLRGDLDAILRKSLKKEPDQRYPSMDAMIGDLEAFLAHRPVSVRRAGVTYFAWRWITRRPYVSVGAALAVGALVLSTVIAVRQAASAREETTKAQREAGRANDISNFLVSLFQVSDPGVNRGERLNADQVLQRGVERVKDEFADKPEERARLEAVIGEVYGSIGDWSRAAPPLTEAVSILRTLPSVSAVELGHDLRILGSLTNTLGDDAPASLALLTESKAVLSKATGLKATEERALASVALGSVFTKLGQLDAGENELRSAQSLAAATGVSDRTTGALVDEGLADLMRKKGDARSAKVEYQRALSIQREELGEDNFETLSTKTALGTTMMDLGEWQQAREIIADVAERQREILGNKHVNYGLSLSVLGGIERELGRYLEADSKLTEAIEIFRDAPGNNSPGLASVLTESGRLSMARKDYASALARFDEAATLYGKSLPPNRGERAMATAWRAEALVGVGRSHEALQQAESALSIARSIDPSQDSLLVEVLYRAGLARHASGDATGARSALTEALERAGRFYSADDFRLADLRNRIGAIDPSLVSN